MEATERAALLALAEEPALSLPPDPAFERLEGERFSLVVRGESASVLRIRLGAGELAAALAEVRATLRRRGVAEAVWWVGELSTPPGLVERLEALGLVPGDPPSLSSLVLEREPASQASVIVQRVADLDDFRRAAELDWEAFAVPAAVRARRRGELEASWRALEADGRVGLYLALLEGRPVGFARAVFTPLGGLLMGGATLPEARGRGVYRSTVLARWADAVARGTPRLIVSAGAMSAPVLERLGFERIGSVRLRADRL